MRKREPAPEPEPDTRPDCPNCNGTGLVRMAPKYRATCPVCNGDRKVDA